MTHLFPSNYLGAWLIVGRGRGHTLTPPLKKNPERPCKKDVRDWRQSKRRQQAG
jgi:hypothetical protein